MKELKELLSTYQNAKPTSETYLDGGYFDIVLGRYAGWVKNPIYVKVSKETLVDPKTGNITQHHNTRVERLGSIPEPSPEDPAIVRVVVEIKKVDIEGEEMMSRHSNLIIIDSNKKKIYRFEPLDRHHYYSHVDNGLRKYFSITFPDYEYNVINVHPQVTKDGFGGFCVAYVIKAAALYITENPIAFPGAPEDQEPDIKLFAGAIQSRYPAPLTEDVEFGPGRGGGGFRGGGGYRGGGGRYYGGGGRYYGGYGGYGYGGYGGGLGLGLGLLTGAALGATLGGAYSTPVYTTPVVAAPVVASPVYSPYYGYY
jgi:hypothetical protein